MEFKKMKKGIMAKRKYQWDIPDALCFNDKRLCLNFSLDDDDDDGIFFKGVFKNCFSIAHLQQHDKRFPKLNKTKSIM